MTPVMEPIMSLSLLQNCFSLLALIRTVRKDVMMRITPIHQPWQHRESCILAAVTLNPVMIVLTLSTFTWSYHLE